MRTLSIPGLGPEDYTRLSPGAASGNVHPEYLEQQDLPWETCTRGPRSCSRKRAPGAPGASEAALGNVHRAHRELISTSFLIELFVYRRMNFQGYTYKHRTGRRSLPTRDRTRALVVKHNHILLNFVKIIIYSTLLLELLSF